MIALPGSPPVTTIDSILSRCVADLVTDCVLWTGSTDAKGYGLSTLRRKNIRVHRYVYEQLKGPIPAGLQLDHLCRVRCCVNPDHLEPVTNAVNVQRGVDARGPKPTCKHGHAMTTENTYVYGRARKCKACALRRTKDWRRNRV